MKQSQYIVKENIEIAPKVMKMILVGDVQEFKNPGQFVNIQIKDHYLRRPISVCEVLQDGFVIVYKIVGEGTKWMSELSSGAKLDVLTGLGNGYDLSLSGNQPVLLGGGVGIPPLYEATKQLISQGKDVTVILGFNKKSEIFFEKEFEKLGAKVYVTTVDGSYGIKGFVTDALKELMYSYFYTCGPEPMLKAVYKQSNTSGQFSFERRMGCGFGACMGCSCKTITGNKRICKEGPVLVKEDILWED